MYAAVLNYPAVNINAIPSVAHVMTHKRMYVPLYVVSHWIVVTTPVINIATLAVVSHARWCIEKALCVHVAELALLQMFDVVIQQLSHAAHIHAASHVHAIQHIAVLKSAILAHAHPVSYSPTSCALVVISDSTLSPAQ